MENGNGDRAAIVWDSPVAGNRGKNGDWTSAKEVYSYKRLLEEVETLAGVLREEGVKKGDVVLIYSMCTMVLGEIATARFPLVALSNFSHRGGLQDTRDADIVQCP